MGVLSCYKKKRGRNLSSDTALTAAHLRPGDKAMIIALDTTALGQHANKLMALGLLPGAEIRLEQRFPTLVLKLGQTTLAVDEAVGQLLKVKPKT